MAKIVTITNPLTGQPAQVDQLDHTAQQIDDGLNIARGVSNPNLLDNWYFGNPVNQRGQTSYTGAGMTVDRWRVEFCGDNSAVTINDGHISFVVNNSTMRFTQTDEKKYYGMYGTVSILTKTDLYSFSGFIFGTAAGGIDVGVGNFYSITSSRGEIINIIDFSVGTHDVVAVKLELGTTQTLAHQDENGVWVLNEIPDYGEQLARCQRYFQTFATESLRPTDALDFRPVMRATPALSTITVGGKTLYTASADL